MSANTLVVLVEDGLKAAVMPEGRSETTRATEPEKPPVPCTVTVLDPEAPSAMERLAEDAESVKLWLGTVSVTVAEPVRLPEVPLIFSG